MIAVMGNSKRRTRTKNIAICSCLLIIAISLCVTGYFLFFHDMVVESFTPKQTSIGSLISNNGESTEKRETSGGIEITGQIDLKDVITTIDVTDPNARKDGFYNFLVVGRDKAGLNTDVIMVASLDMKNNKAAIVQIPRDTYVEASPLAGNKKINAIFSTGYSDIRRKNGSVEECIEGGMTALSDALLSSFGIVIDRYVHINIQGFRQIVDSIGGVEVTVQQDMYYNDPEQGLLINIPAGTHVLDGKTAEGFVRYRSGYQDADLGRMEAQKIFMTALMKKLLSTSTVAKIPELVSVVSDNIVTNVSVADMTSFATAAFKLDLGNISMFSMEGYPLMYKEVSYVSMYPKANLKLVNDHFNVFNSDITIDDIKIKILVDEPDGYTIEQTTAEDVSNRPPQLNYVYKKPAESATASTQTKTPSTTQTPSAPTSAATPTPSQTPDAPAVQDTATSSGVPEGVPEGVIIKEGEIDLAPQEPPKIESTPTEEDDEDAEQTDSNDAQGETESDATATAPATDAESAEPSESTDTPAADGEGSAVTDGEAPVDER